MIASLEFGQRLNRLVARFYRGLRSHEGCAPEAVTTAEARLGVTLPFALREFYLQCGQREDLLNSYDKLRLPQDLRVEGDHLVFADENQGACQWGIRLAPEHDDPSVERMDFTSKPVWEPDHDFLSGFMTRFVLWQAVNGGAPAGGIATTDASIFPRIAAWQNLEEHGSHWAQTRFAASDSRLLCLIGSDEVSVHAAARDVAAFASLADILNLKWDYEWPEERA